MNEEDFIRTLTQQKPNPFRTPEGYFDSLADRIISRLPEEKQQKPALIKRLRPWLYAAAFAGVVALSATLYLNHSDDSLKNNEVLVASNDTYFEDAADYAMVDNQDIYASLLADM